MIEQLQVERKSICFIGDGINDSIALKKAPVSISLKGKCCHRHGSNRFDGWKA
ncbi:MAG TPA: hypothetical protein DCM38_01630 [Gammaproteobacteria bacterium]|nr:hypothetical protein [Gammaproteobacteria bacterium]